MTKASRQKKYYSVDQKREYAKLMVEEGYSNKAIRTLSGACLSAVARWKRQYLSERSGTTPIGKPACSGQEKL